MLSTVRKEASCSEPGAITINGNQARGVLWLVNYQISSSVYFWFLCCYWTVSATGRELVHRSFGWPCILVAVKVAVRRHTPHDHCPCCFDILFGGSFVAYAITSMKLVKLHRCNIYNDAYYLVSSIFEALVPCSLCRLVLRLCQARQKLSLIGPPR